MLDGLRVTDLQRRALGLHRPLTARVALARDVELVDGAAQLVGIVEAGALDDRIQRAAVLARGNGLPAAAALDRGLLARLQVRAGRGLAARERERRVEHLAGGVGVDQVRAELLSEPEVAAAVAGDRLDVEVAAGEQPLGRVLIDDLERDLAIRVTQAQEAVDLDLVRVPVGRMRYTRSRKSRELPLVPKPLSGIAR